MSASGAWRWARWLAAASLAVLAARLLLGLAMPAAGSAFLWGSAFPLGFAVVFFLLPLPNEPA